MKTLMRNPVFVAVKPPEFDRTNIGNRKKTAEICDFLLAIPAILTYNIKVA
jgi:hypothetical protein